MAAITPPPAPQVPIPCRGVDYRNKVCLAPMVRSGELPSRLLALHYGADLVWGPETIDRSLIGCTSALNPRTSTIDFTRPSNSSDPLSARSLIYRLHPTLEGPRLIFQLGTASPTTAVAAALLVAPHVAGIDVNAGCPKPFSTSGGMGAALLRTPSLLCAILSSLVAHVGVPHQIGISVKIRVLPSAADTAALVTSLCRTGITGLTIHCRTPAMRPREPAVRDQLPALAAICRAHGVACLMNGDVASRPAALALAAAHGADGAMIATAAEANPSVFAPTGPRPWQEVARRYMQLALQVENKYGNAKFTLQHLVPGRTAVKMGANEARGYEQMCERLGYEDLRERAREVDRQLRIRPVEERTEVVVGKRKASTEDRERERRVKEAVRPEPDQLDAGLCSPMYAAPALTS